MALLIPLTDEQLTALQPLFHRLHDGGAVVGQLYIDGTMLVNVLDPATTMRLFAALGRVPSRASYDRFGMDVHERNKGDTDAEEL